MLLPYPGGVALLWYLQRLGVTLSKVPSLRPSTHCPSPHHLQEAHGGPGSTSLPGGPAGFPLSLGILGVTSSLPFCPAQPLWPKSCSFPCVREGHAGEMAKAG